MLSTFLTLLGMFLIVSSFSAVPFLDRTRYYETYIRYVLVA